ncbi:MAG TPA: caspase family protein, partial [Cyclobacteriaceae bacterium]|nr:caspase family protein [Cyclobacteriaceae bacterium]
MMKRILVFIAVLAPLVCQAQVKVLSNVKTKPGLSAVFLNSSEEVLVSSNKIIVRGNALSGVVTREYTGHNGTVTSLSVSRDGKFMLTGSDDKTVRRWDLQTNETKILPIGEKVTSVFFAAASDQCIVLDQSGRVTLWAIESGKPSTIHGADKSVSGIGLNNDGSFVAIATSKGAISVKNVITAEVLKTWNGHTDKITSLTFANNNDWLASVGDDGFLKKWSVADWSLLGEVSYGKGKMNHLSVSRDDSHVSACGGNGCSIFNTTSLAQVSIINKLSSIPINSAFSPDGKMMVIMQDLVPRAEVWDISSLGISQFTILKDASDKTPPQLYVSSPANTSEGFVIVYTDLLAIKGTVIDDAGVSQLRINGLETPMRNNGNFTIMQPLVVGENLINIEATDINGNTALKKFIVSRRNVDGEPYDATKAKNYLMVVGINSYEYWPKLNNAVKDANDVAQTLRSIYKFDFDDVTLLTNETATRNNIYKALRDFVTKVTPQDNFMIYFSGHGYFDELLNEGYWVPVDAKVNSTGDYLSNSDILKVIGNINSQHTFLVADACFSGSLFSDTKRGYIENVERFKSRW